MIQIFRTDFGRQSADRGGDEAPESESDEAAARLRGVSQLGKSAM